MLSFLVFRVPYLVLCKSRVSIYEDLGIKRNFGVCTTLPWSCLDDFPSTVPNRSVHTTTMICFPLPTLRMLILIVNDNIPLHLLLPPFASASYISPFSSFDFPCPFLLSLPHFDCINGYLQSLHLRNALIPSKFWPSLNACSSFFVV